MPLKLFSFSIVDLRERQTVAFAVEALTIEAAWGAGAPTLPANFGGRASGLRLFRFAFTNGATQESSALIGQGDTVAAAWADAVKNTREAFRPKQDGRFREHVGVTILRPNGRAAARSLESFGGEETWEEESRRVRIEAERKRQALAMAAAASAVGGAWRQPGRAA